VTSAGRLCQSTGAKAAAPVHCAILPADIQLEDGAEIRFGGELIRAIRSEFELSVLLVEHHMAMVMAISDKIVVLDFGSQIAEGGPEEIRDNPRVIEAYLGTPQ